MSSSSNVEDLLRKLAHPAQKVGKTRVKFDWRRRQSSKRGIKLTEVERQELKEKREEKRVKLEDALKTARDTIYKMAEAMSDENDRFISAELSQPFKELDFAHNVQGRCCR